MKGIRVFLWASFAVGAVLSVIAQVHSVDTSRIIPVVVRRRSSLDIYTILQGNRTEVDNRCDVDNATYLVKENQCIDNQYLSNECSFVITPSIEPNTSRLFLNIEMAGTATTAQTLTMNDMIADAVVALRGRAENTRLNSSTCQISSLEVYRGREQVIEISHQGFSLSDNGSTIKIYLNQLAYSFEEYIGELYRMNLSCSGGGLPQSGCLFLKVGGRTDISEAKFNCSVPGTLSPQCPSTTNDMTTTLTINTQDPSTSHSQPTTDSIQTMTNSTTPVVSQPNTLEIGSPLFYGIVGAGATVIIMTLLCLICICVMLGCRRECKCGPRIGAVNNKGQPAPYEDIEIRGVKPQSYNPSFRAESIGSFNTTEQDLENKYAEIGATYQEISPRVCNPKQPAWARTSSAVTNAGSEQPQHEYSTLVQVGGQTLRNNLANSMSDINSEQYAQLMISK